MKPHLLVTWGDGRVDVAVAGLPVDRVPGLFRLLITARLQAGAAKEQGA